MNTKKINYGNKKMEAGNSEIQKLKEGDQLCEQLLGDCTSEYLLYISHLLKNTKTPSKNNTQKQIKSSSSDEQPPQKWENVLPHELQKTQHLHNQSKARRHSEASAKIPSYNRNLESKKVKNRNESVKVSPRGKANEVGEKEQEGRRNRKRKVEYNNSDMLLKNEQKTMQFSRNTVQQARPNRQYDFQKDLHKKSRVTHKSRDKYYVTSQNYQEDSDREEPSIELPFKKQLKLRQRQTQSNFIDNINEYITTLEENESVTFNQNNRQSEEERGRERELEVERERRRARRSRHGQAQSEYDMQEVFKENLKLSKKVRSYEQKITQLDEEIANHLLHCKNKQKSYKNKVNYLLRGLIQAFMKIDCQEGEIAALKDLHRSYGEKVKKIDTRYEDDDILEDIREELFKNLAPKRHSSQIRTKQKRTLQSTLPKYEEDRRLW